MDGKLGYLYITSSGLHGTARVRWCEFSTATGALAAASGGGGSLLSAGLIIWAMSGWVCLSRRIRVISRVNAAGLSTSSFASASACQGQWQ